MARGNQRDKAREANQKKLADQKKSNSMSGTEMKREKEAVAAKMRQKQAEADAKKAGVETPPPAHIPVVKKDPLKDDAAPKKDTPKKDSGKKDAPKKDAPKKK